MPYYRIDVKVINNFTVKETRLIELEYLAENDTCIVFNDFQFSRVDKFKSNGCNFNDILNDVHIREFNYPTEVEIFGKFWITGIVEGTVEEIEKKVNKEFNKWLKDKASSYNSKQTVNITFNLKED